MSKQRATDIANYNIRGYEAEIEFLEERAAIAVIEQIDTE